MTRAAIHHGRAQALHAERTRVLAQADRARPNDSSTGHPRRPTALPTAAWINKPNTDEAAH